MNHRAARCRYIRIPNHDDEVHALRTPGFVSSWRFFALLALLGFFLASTLSVAQDPQKAHLGYLSPGDIPRYDNAFLQGLQDQGYILPGEILRYDEQLWRNLEKQGFFEGKKLRIDIRATIEHYPQHAPELAAELVRLNVDLIYAATPPEAKAAQAAVQQAHKTTPIIFGPHPDPVGAQVVASLARPGGNMTGLAWEDPELIGKLVQILKETFPKLANIAYIHERTMYTDTLSRRAKQAAEAAAQELGLRLATFEVGRPKDIQIALAAIARGHVQGMVVSKGPLTLTERHRIVNFAAQRHLPTIYGEALFVDVGGLMSYGAPYSERVRYATAVVAKVLEGAKPADIPVEQPTRFRLLINSRTAKALGVTIPAAVLARAEMVEITDP